MLSFLSGVLVCLSFPTLIAGAHFPEMGFIAWVALVPLITAIRSATPRRAFLLTFFSALVWYSGSLFWVFRAMHTFGGLSALASFLILVLLVIIVSAYIAIAPMIALKIARDYRGEMIVWLPVCWTAVEVLRNYVPCNGFPWSNLAMSQWRILPIIQIADIAGIYGVIFLVVWVNVFAAEIVAIIRGEKIMFMIPKAVVTMMLVVSALAYGFWRILAVNESLPGAATMNVGIVQGNIAQEDKWEDENAAQNLKVYSDGSARLLKGSVEMIVWPEAAFPWSIDLNSNEIDPRAIGLPKGLGDIPYTLFGAVSARPDGAYFNSAILFDARGRIAGRYHKSHLVPFGEYVPYEKLLFFAHKLTEPAGNFLAGESFEPLLAGQARIGALICYEDIFPEVARQETMAGANVLMNITNDAWYGVSSAPYQHLAFSVFRAVENRRFLARATNSGVSAIVTPAGDTQVESGIFERALIASPVALLDNISFYTRYGDWFAWGCAAYAVFGVAAGIYRRRQIARG